MFQFFRGFKAFWYSQDDLKKAIETKDEAHFRYLLEDLGVDGITNENEKRLSPLATCYMHDQWKFAFMLLAKGANPNDTYPHAFTSKPTKILQAIVDPSHADHENLLNQAYMFIYFGANLENINCTEKVKKLLETKRRFYVDKIQPWLHQKNESAYQELGQVWLELCDGEKDKILKQCYRDRATDYFKQAELARDEKTAKQNIKNPPSKNLPHSSLASHLPTWPLLRNRKAYMPLTTQEESEKEHDTTGKELITKDLPAHTR